MTRFRLPISFRASRGERLPIALVRRSRAPFLRRLRSAICAACVIGVCGLVIGTRIRPGFAVGRVEGTMPNRSYPTGELFTQISPQMSALHLNQPSVYNGYLVLA